VATSVVLKGLIMVNVLWVLLLVTTPLSNGLKIQKDAQPLELYTFKEFTEKYWRTSEPETAEWSEREKIFNANFVFDGVFSFA
jgi:hypothetical protein